MLEIEIPGYKGSSPPTGGTKWSQLDKPTRFGLVLYGLVWFGLVWFGLVWFGMAWFVFPKTTTCGFGTNKSSQSHNLGPWEKDPDLRHERALGESYTIRNL